MTWYTTSYFKVFHSEEIHSSSLSLENHHCLNHHSTCFSYSSFICHQLLIRGFYTICIWSCPPRYSLVSNRSRISSVADLIHLLWVHHIKCSFVLKQKRNSLIKFMSFQNCMLQLSDFCYHVWPSSEHPVLSFQSWFITWNCRISLDMIYVLWMQEWRSTLDLLL